MKTWSHSLWRAIGFELIQHGRNRFALGLVVAFIPFWLSLVHGIITDQKIEFMYGPQQRFVPVVASDLTLITAAINAVTLIVGFMMFAATFRSGDFDQRLALAGFPRSSLLLAKLVALMGISGVVSAYAWGVMLVFFSPEQPWLLWVSLFGCGLTYGGIGVVLGVVARTELVGMFLIIMISLVDVMVQNPVLNPSSDSDVLRLLPSYGSMQSGVAAAFTSDVPVEYVLFGPAWLAGFTLFGLVTFYARTRDHTQRSTEGSQATGTASPAVVIVTAREDGSIAVKSSTGPVVVCSRLTGDTSAITSAGSGRHRGDDAGSRGTSAGCGCP